MSQALGKLELNAFLAWENAQEDRHEFVRGEVFAVVGARRAHCDVTVNLTGLLWNALRGSPCRVYSESRKLQVANDVFCPDVVVSSSAADLAGDAPMVEPLFIVELLSPSSHTYDRGLKFAHYRRLASLKEYLTIDPDTRRVEGFRFSDAGWVLHDMSEADTLHLGSLGIDLPMAEVFAGVEVTGGTAPAPDVPVA
jgi:Uma2 family endonuclease